MSVSKKVALRESREELTSPHLSQEDIARRANISLLTYRNAEKGNRVQYSTAKAIVDALNDARAEQGKEQVTLEQLNIQLA